MVCKIQRPGVDKQGPHRRVIRCLPPLEGVDEDVLAGELALDERITAFGGRRLISLEGGNRGVGTLGGAAVRGYGDLN